jgi:hypothetical protein
MLLIVDFLLVRIGCCFPNTQPRLKSWYDQFEKRDESSACEDMATNDRHKTQSRPASSNKRRG